MTAGLGLVIVASLPEAAALEAPLLGNLGCDILRKWRPPPLRRPGRLEMVMAVTGLRRSFYQGHSRGFPRIPWHHFTSWDHRWGPITPMESRGSDHSDHKDNWPAFRLNPLSYHPPSTIKCSLSCLC